MGEQKLLLPHQTCCGIGKHSSVQGQKAGVVQQPLPAQIQDAAVRRLCLRNPLGAQSSPGREQPPQIPSWGGASLPSPCISIPQVPQRKVPAWCSWWTCGTPTWPRPSAKPSTSSSRRDDDGAARPGGFRAARLGILPAHTASVLPPGGLVNGNCDVYPRPSPSSIVGFRDSFPSAGVSAPPGLAAPLLLRVLLLLCFAVFRSRVTNPRVLV